MRLRRGGRESGTAVRAVVEEKCLSSLRMILEVSKGTIGRLTLVQNVGKVC
jgi:hypothetical protein